jgi:signal transduction histidine kinase
MPIARRSWFRWPALAALAAVVVGVAGGLAWEAWQATERHRAAARGTLRDHAEFAAIAFRQGLIGRAWMAVDGIFRPAGYARGFPPGPLLTLPQLRRAAEELGGLRPRYYFRLTLADSALEVDGAVLSAEQRAYLISEINRPRVREWLQWDYNSVVDTLGPEPELVYLSARRGPGERLLVVDGFAVGMDQVAAMLMRPVLSGPPLLAIRRPDRLSNDSLLSVSLLQPNGSRALEISPERYPDDYSATIHASRFLGAWTLRAALNPELAPRLLIGGLPPSRTPILAAMVLLAGLLVGGAVFVVGRALELARLRSEFVASVSHELKTPLAQILLFGESLTLGRMHSRGDVRSAGGIIVAEARRLMRLVDNVLLFGRNARPVPPPTIAAPLAPLLRDAISAFAPIAEAADSRVSAARVDEVAAPVDQHGLRQVLLNLLDNAVKYGPRGQRIQLGLAAVDGHARLWVEDEGPGIPADERERVWQPFVRLRRDVDRQTAGSGIGLSLVRDFVARHGGSACIEETPAGGTRIVVDLPGARPVTEGASCES